MSGKWPAMELKRRDPSWSPSDMRGFSRCTCGCQAESETYLPVTCFLGDEAIEAVARHRFEGGYGNPDGLSWDEALVRNLDAVDELRDEAKRDLHAAVESQTQLAPGGKDQ